MTPDPRHSAARPGVAVVVAVLVLVMPVAVPARAGTGRGSPAAPPSEGAALSLLRKAARTGNASSDTEYAGLRLISAWTPSGTTTKLVAVRSVPGRGTLVRTLGAGPSGTGMVDALDSADRLAGSVMRALAANYRLSVAGTSSVAGRSARLVKVRRGNGSLAACFWIDRKTGLMLRREFRDKQGKTTRVSAYLRFRSGPSAHRANRQGQYGPLPASTSSTPEPWRQRLNGAELAALRHGGWILPPELPGGLELVEARRDGARGETVVHLSYSDGLSRVSLFVQRGTLGTRGLRGWQRTEIEGRVVYRQHTIPRRAVWCGDGQVYTVVADAPPQVVREVVATLPHASRSGRVLGRIGRGFTQMGAWLNPLG